VPGYGEYHCPVPLPIQINGTKGIPLQPVTSTSVPSKISLRMWLSLEIKLQRIVWGFKHRCYILYCRSRFVLGLTPLIAANKLKVPTEEQQGLMLIA